MTRKIPSLLAPILLLSLTAASGSAEPPADKAAVDVHLSEYAIQMPRTLPAGPTTFAVHNDGKKIHSFRIEGPGFSEILEKPVQPQQEENLQVTLQPGEYKVYCPVGSHEVKGMKMTLTVTPRQDG
jgi:plastocyanin